MRATPIVLGANVTKEILCHHFFKKHSSWFCQFIPIWDSTYNASNTSMVRFSLCFGNCFKIFRPMVYTGKESLLEGCREGQVSCKHDSTPSANASGSPALNNRQQISAKAEERRVGHCTTDAKWWDVTTLGKTLTLLLSLDWTMPMNAVCLDVYTARCLYLNSMRLTFWPVGLHQNLWSHAEHSETLQDNDHYHMTQEKMEVNT